jgi:hypothetical protein
LLSVGTFKLYDMWDRDHYREDQWWNAHTRDWPVMVRYLGEKNEWPDRLAHCGRYPQTMGRGGGFATPNRIQHWGWATPEDRLAKYERYKLHDPDCKFGVKEQYESILDLHPNLVRWRD